MQISRYCVVAILLTLLLAGCAQPTPPAATPTRALPTISPSPELTATRTRRATLTRSPTRTRTPTPTPTIIPTVDPSIPTLLPSMVIERFNEAAWSPTANQLAGIFGHGDGTAKLSIASAPDFAVQEFKLDNTVYDEGSIFEFGVDWSPNGDWIIFGGAEQEVPIYRYIYAYAIRPSGQGAHKIYSGQNSGSSLEFQGWITPQILAFSDTFSPGAKSVWIVNFYSGSRVTYARLTGQVYPAGSVGVPFDVYFGCAPVVVGIVTLSGPPEDDTNIQTDHVRWFPGYQNDCHSYTSNENMHFLGWHPNMDRMLVSIDYMDQRVDKDITTIELLEWDLNTDEVSQLAPNGVDAEYSADGKWLRLVTYGEPALNPDGSIRLMDPGTLTVDTHQYVQLINAATNAVVLNQPLAYPISRLEYYYSDFLDRGSFSPDSRYLATITTAEGAPGGAYLDSMLQIIDLETLEVVASVPNVKQDSVLWSPDSEKLLYRLLDDSSGILTLPGGERTMLQTDDFRYVYGIAWSFDSQYLSAQGMKDTPQQENVTLIYQFP